MFLNLLTKNQKRLFLELVVKATEANGVVEIEEKNMLKEFALQMQETPVYSTEKSTEELLKLIKMDSSETNLKIIVFEILGVMYSDKVYDSKEKDFINNMVNIFELSQDIPDEFDKLIVKYASLYKEILGKVIGE